MDNKFKKNERSYADCLNLVEHIKNQLEILKEEIEDRNKLIKYQTQAIDRLKAQVKEAKEIKNATALEGIDLKINMCVQKEKIKKRSAHFWRLDDLLGKRVKIIFKNDECSEGILYFQENFSKNKIAVPNSYYLKLENCTCLCFKKSHVKEYFNLEN